MVICRSQKPEARKGRILFIDAVAEIARERAQSFLRPDHQARILSAYHAFADDPGFAAVAEVADVLAADEAMLCNSLIGFWPIARYQQRRWSVFTASEALNSAWLAPESAISG